MVIPFGPTAVRLSARVMVVESAPEAVMPSAPLAVIPSAPEAVMPSAPEAVMPFGMKGETAVGAARRDSRSVNKTDAVGARTR